MATNGDSALKLFLATLLLVTAAAAQSGYHLVKQIAVPGEGGQDYLYADGPNHRVYVSHGTSVAVIDTGKVITTVPIGEHVDATAYDATRQVILNANRATVTVIREDSADKYTAVETFNSSPHANTLAIDPATHRVYLAASLYDAAPATTDGKPGRQTLKPGTFTVFVFAPK